MYVYIHIYIYTYIHIYVSLYIPYRLEDCTLYVTLEPCAMCAVRNFYFFFIFFLNNVSV